MLTYTGTLALLVESDAIVAVIWCSPAVDGGVYKPLLEMVPTVEFPPAMPSTDQFTVVFAVN